MAEREFRNDERAISPVIEKTVTAGLVVLYIGTMTTLLFGGIVPSYETASGNEVGERTLAAAAGEIEAAAPQRSTETSIRRTVNLPATIDGSGYSIVLSDSELRLEHPDEDIGATTKLAVDDDLTLQSGRWESGSPFVIEADGNGTGRYLTIGGES